MRNHVTVIPSTLCKRCAAHLTCTRRPRPNDTWQLLPLRLPCTHTHPSPRAVPTQRCCAKRTVVFMLFPVFSSTDMTVISVPPKCMEVSRRRLVASPMGGTSTVMLPTSWVSDESGNTHLHKISRMEQTTGHQVKCVRHVSLQPSECSYRVRSYSAVSCMAMAVGAAPHSVLLSSVA